jgi:hypothetical protein
MVLIYNRFFKKDKNLRYEDYCNDGLVDLTSAMHPNDEPHVRFNSDDIKPGVWNVMKPRIGDHGTPIGLLSPVEDTFKLYDSMFNHLYDVEQLIEN